MQFFGLLIFRENAFHVSRHIHSSKNSQKRNTHKLLFSFDPLTMSVSRHQLYPSLEEDLAVSWDSSNLEDQSSNPKAVPSAPPLPEFEEVEAPWTLKQIEEWMEEGNKMTITVEYLEEQSPIPPSATCKEVFPDDEDWPLEMVDEWILATNRKIDHHPMPNSLEKIQEPRSMEKVQWIQHENPRCPMTLVQTDEKIKVPSIRKPKIKKPRLRQALKKMQQFFGVNKSYIQPV